MQGVAAITLDLDDTLWEILPVIQRAEQDLYDHMTQVFPRVGDRYSAQSLRDVRNDVAARYPELSHDLTESRRLSLEYILTACGYDPDESHQLIDLFLDLRHRVELYPDVIPALERLAQDYALVAVSNGNACVEKVGLGTYFAGQVSAREFGVSKPDPSIFLEACRLLEADPESVLHIGDHPVDDVLGAQRAGMKTVWINRGEQAWSHSHTPHGEAGTLEAVVPMLSGV